MNLLFAIGPVLELATLNTTRSALAELIAVAADTAVVTRENQQVKIDAAETSGQDTPPV